ncbi:RNA-directed DNA polymerase, eukaryota, reverse transcriptase zinc-binding domain protein [Tanacetum coccineum]
MEEGLQAKESGGLGLKSLSKWNETLLAKHIWNLATKKESLWVNWVNTVKLKGRSIWDVEKEYSDSWMWKNLLDLRENVRKHVIFSVRNGQKVSMWYDWWDDNGPLCNIISKEIINDPGLCNESTMDDLIHDEDTALWKTKCDKKVKFSTKSVWEDFREDDNEVQWNKLVWFTQCIPSHMFIVWMAINERLQTQDRIMKWKNDTNMRCSLCKKCSDLHDHLFFQCQFSKNIWNDFQLKEALKDRPTNWKETISTLATWFTNNSIVSVVGKLVFGAMVYYIWQERNRRVFTQDRRDEKAIIEIITKSVRMRLMGLKVYKTSQVIKVFERWKIQPVFVKSAIKECLG